jgi:MFS transporter, FHS family, glucose/mannose:H+ symporter
VLVIISRSLSNRLTATRSLLRRPRYADNHFMPVGEPIVYSSQRDRQLAPLLNSGFLLVGVVNTLLGPILPMLAARWRLHDAEAGSLFIAQFTGAMIGSALSSPMIERWGTLRLIACGYAAMAAAVVCLGVNSWGIGLLSVFSSGFALGLITPATNLLVAEINSERRAAALNILSVAWALGAVAGPPLIALFARDGLLLRPLIGLATLLSLIALLIARRSVTDSSSGPHQPKPNQKDPARFERSALRAWASPYALLTGGLIFIYVGTETAAGGWIASYAQRLGASASGFGTMTPSFFWAGLLIGRAAAPAVLRRVSEAALVSTSLFVAGAGLVLILVASSVMTVSSGAGLTGLGLAAVFPTTFAIFTRHFGRQASQLTGFFFVLAGLGGALIPWLVGFISARFGDLRIGLLIPLFGVASMIVLQIVIVRVLARGQLQSR